jgi:hypothetical protein
MRPTLFSIEALAVELDRDRRTVGRALRATPPDGEVQGKPRWFLSTAVRALDRRQGNVRSGNSSDFAAACEKALRLLDQVRDGFDEAEAEADLSRRRQILVGFGKNIGRADAALKRLAAGLTPGERGALETLGELALAESVAQFCRLGAWQCPEAGIVLPPEIIKDAEAQLAAHRDSVTRPDQTEPI